MLTGFLRAILQLTDSRLTSILIRVVFLSMLVFVALWIGLAYLLNSEAMTEIPVVNWLIGALGGVVAIVATLFLFPVVVSVILGFYLEPIAAAVEAKYYPNLPEPKGVGVMGGAWAGVRFFLKALVVNLVLLVFLFAPALYPFAWMLANGYLLGREYFELVAFRRLSAGEARGLRHTHRWATLFGGIVGTLLFLVPIVNLLAPVILTMAMVHPVERWRSKN